MTSPSDEPSYQARLEAVLESVNEGFYALDTDWRLVVFNRAAEEYFGVALRAAMDGESTTFETASLLRPDTVVEVKVAPLRGGGAAVTLNDVTERRRTEARQRLLVNELNHRVKNALATVQAIAAQSLRGHDVPPEARERFMARLMALARANDMLVSEDWQGASLAAVAAEAAGPHGASERFEIAGPPVRLNPQAATALALGLHELATNAAKYGSLSAPEGRVTLTWTVDGPAERRRLDLVWRETGGPRVVPPTRTGFGARLIQRGLAGGLKAQVKLDYRPEGLVFTLNAPLGETISEG